MPETPLVMRSAVVFDPIARARHPVNEVPHADADQQYRHEEPADVEQADVSEEEKRAQANEPDCTGRNRTVRPGRYRRNDGRDKRRLRSVVLRCAPVRDRWSIGVGWSV